MSGEQTWPQPSMRRGPGRPPQVTQQTGRTTRETVVDVAVELFAARGFHATSVAELGQGAGLAPGALYHHIGSKEELLWQILHTYTSEALAGARRIADAAGDPVDKLRDLIGFHVETIATHRREVLIQMRDAEALTGDRAVELQEMRRRVQDCWQAVLDQGHQASRIRSSDRVVVNSILAMVNMVATWYRPDRGDTPQSVAEQICAMVIDGLAIDHGRPTTRASGAGRR
ncbi:transcriptional regulator, TetR family [Mycolicibacterium rhodesiae JS60]|nr:transcriptional regulator, TetR family [Mycolicibacterium rhodesiae JS60]